MAKALVAILTATPGLNPRPVCVEFVVDRVTLKQNFFRVLWFSLPVSPKMFHVHSFVYHRHYTISTNWRDRYIAQQDIEQNTSTDSRTLLSDPTLNRHKQLKQCRKARSQQIRHSVQQYYSTVFIHRVSQSMRAILVVLRRGTVLAMTTDNTELPQTSTTSKVSSYIQVGATLHQV
jgi:hypothetical protein